ncbi:MAG: GyrI-like domain-containing protein [Bacteroidales bacterium]
MQEYFEPRIETIPAKKLVGRRIKMTLASNRTTELWRSFMPHRKLIKNTIASDLYSVQAYNSSLDFNQFNQHTEFEKWAAVEVSDSNSVPEGMECFILEGGLYAVFTYIGHPEDFKDFFQFIFYTWMPASRYDLDSRAHFDLLGEKYRNNDPSSEEEIWVPIRYKENHG